MEFTNLIQEWLSLQNIVSNKNFNQSFLKPLNKDEFDLCNDNEGNIKIDCNERNENKCSIYKSYSTFKESCVSKDRISKYEKDTIIFGKNKGQYRIIETQKIIYIIENVEVEIYYYILLSQETNNYYILFSTGYVLNKQINEIEEIVSFLQTLIKYIINIESTAKIIICGHSFGCILSLYTGYLLNSQYPELFVSRCIIFGSGPFKFINKEIFAFSKLENVKIFILGRIIDEREILLDCYSNLGPGNYIYEPITYILINYETEKIISINDITGYSINYLNDFWCDGFHSWKNYYINLIRIYGIFIRNKLLDTIFIYKNFGGRITKRKIKRKIKRKSKSKRKSRKNK
jgi:hypothetical protein